MIALFKSKKSYFTAFINYTFPTFLYDNHSFIIIYTPFRFPYL
ncbi:hypothetical protein RV02_GL003233 [Enterococcus gilvus]|nr:hypothetical protein RV02_GL003233 [Enterococcus gilvus]